MGNSPPKDCCGIYFYIADEDNYTIQEGGLIEMGRDFGCLIDNLSDNDLELLRQWVKRFIDTDEFLRSKNDGPFAGISRFVFIIDRIPSAAWEVLDIELDAVSDNTAGDETSEDEYSDNTAGDETSEDEYSDNTAGDETSEDEYSDNTAGDETSEDEYSDFTEDDEMYQRQSQKKFLEMLLMGHNDYQQYIKGKSEAEVRGDLKSPYRILHEIARRAAVVKNSLSKSISADNEPIDIITSPKNKKKGGRPEKARTRWIWEQCKKDLNDLDICRKWNNLSDEERAKIDPKNPKPFDLSNKNAMRLSKECVRGVRKRKMKKDCSSEKLVP